MPASCKISTEAEHWGIFDTFTVYKDHLCSTLDVQILNNLIKMLEKYIEIG